MKNPAVTFLLVLPIFISAQNSTYILSSYKDAGVKAPNTHYLGEAWLNSLLKADETLDYNITKATFKKNSTLD